MLIVHDELDLLPGNIKIKLSNGHNGHNGLRNIVKNFKNKKFYRICIGIGRPKYCKQISSYVLSNPTILDKIKIKFIIKYMINITDNLIKDMNMSFLNKLLHKHSLLIK